MPPPVPENTLSAGDVISLSVQNLIAAISSHRPWPEFVALGAIDCPDSFSSSASRAKLTLRHFRVNYCLLTAASAAVFLIGDPTALLIVAAAAVMRLLLYFFREDPPALYGRRSSYGAVVVGLILFSLWVLWFTRHLGTLALGVGTSVILSGIHAVVRNPGDLFVGDNDTVSRGFLHWS